MGGTVSISLTTDFVGDPVRHLFLARGPGTGVSTLAPERCPVAGTTGSDCAATDRDSSSAVVSDFVDGISGIGEVFRYPPIRDPLYYWFDLSAGLFLVALSEELVFRKLARQWLEALSFGPVASVLISAVVFGLVHWGGGAGQIAYAAMVGVAYMTAYLVFNRLWLLVLAHWLQNFLVFGPFDPF